MGKKSIAPILMLTAAALTSITMYIMHFELKTLLTVLLIVMIVFYIAGLVIGKTITSFQAANEKAEVPDEGEVIEKEAAVPEGEEKEKEPVEQEKREEKESQAEGSEQET